MKSPSKQIGKSWHRKWTPLGLIDLSRIRARMRLHNLYDTESLPHRPGTALLIDPKVADNPPSARTADGAYTDAGNPNMGRRGTRLGRNVPLDRVYPDKKNLMEPNPRLISRKLLTRDEFVPAKTLNLLAACWIQFMQHGWFNHTEDSERKPDRHNLKDPMIVPIGPGDRWPEANPPPEDGAWKDGSRPEEFRPMSIFRTPRDPTRIPGAEDGPPTYLNTVSHWWDASQLYGDDEKTQRDVRSGRDGKLKFEPDGKLHYDPKGLCPDIPVVGFIDNWWLGLGLLYKLFIQEHNAVCDLLKEKHPAWSDQELFDHARLVISALLAKIHTTEWTPGLCGCAALDIAMKANWWGIRRERRLVYRLILGAALKIGGFFLKSFRQDAKEGYYGILATDPDHHAAPYSLTEEFAAMYRLHPLIPDEFDLRSAKSNEVLAKKNLFEISGSNSRAILESSRLADLVYSFGITNPGALRLHNYPRFLQNLRRENGDRFDLAVIDVLRDRERGVPRYNEFRDLVGLPRAETFEEMTDDPRWAQELKEVYGEVDRVDVMVGMFAEPLIPGFAISETAFRIFILMASRRLKSDRFFTTDYRPEIYTQEGLDWIEHNSMASVILRHLPELESSINKANAFAPWTPVSRKS